MIRLILLTITLTLGTTATYSQSSLKDHDTYQAIDISADRLEVKQKRGQALFKGSVKVLQGGMILTSDVLTVYYKNTTGEEDPSIERLDATGRVKLESTSESVVGDWGIYDVDSRLVTVGGNVTLVRGPNTLKGNRLELNLVSGLAKLDGEEADNGRVRGRFSVPSDSNADNGG